MLDEIARRRPYAALEKKGALLASLLSAEIDRRGLAGRVCLTRAGSLLTLFFAAGPMRNFADVKRSDVKRYAAFFHAMRERGVFLPPAQFEAWFLSTVHTDAEIRRAARAAGESLALAFA
jgi:glutamate-1-semialdehyde 2,1-aminomutase